MKKAEEHHSPIIEALMAEITPQQRKRTETRMLLAAKIADAMRAKGWKKKDLAAAMNVRPSLVTKWLSGNNNFTADLLSDIGLLLGVRLLAVEDEKKVDPQTLCFVVHVTTQQTIEPGTTHIPSSPFTQPAAVTSSWAGQTALA